MKTNEQIERVARKMHDIGSHLQLLVSDGFPDNKRLSWEELNKIDRLKYRLAAAEVLSLVREFPT